MYSPLIILLVLGVCYSRTIALDITWANFSADGGDLITAAATSGVPHPSGYPLYVTLARAFQFLPVGTLAFRTNLFSAVCTILASFLLFRFLTSQFQGSPFSNFSSLISALAYGLSPFIWGQALVTEVYALHGLLMISCIYVLGNKNTKISEWARGMYFGLAATNHLSSIMLFPLLSINFEKKSFVSSPVFRKRILGILTGLSLYLILPLRAYFDPPINWGNASTLNGFFWLVSGKLYHTYSFSLPLTDILQRSRAFVGLLLDQYTWVGILLGIYGIFYPSIPRIRIPLLWISGTFLLFAILYGSKDSQVNLLPVWLCFAIWMAFGLQDLFSWVKNHTYQICIAGFLSMLLFIRVLALLPAMDISHDHTAQEFITNVTEKAPQNAFVIANSDETIFSLWYSQLALGIRPDLIVISQGLLPFDWYQESLQKTYPAVNFPEESKTPLFDLLAANPQRAVCRISGGNLPVCK